jgi:hypothetical protein
MRWHALAILCALGASVCSVTVGCSSSCNACEGNEVATLALSCGPTDLTAVKFSGPCPSNGDGSNVGEYVDNQTQSNVYVGATSAGTCTVTLVFATGFTFTTDVTFSEAPNGGCSGCLPVLKPSPAVVTVNNPSSTCMVDAGEGDGDASPSDASAN